MEVRADWSTGTPDLIASPSDLVVLPSYLHTSAAVGSPHMPSALEAGVGHPATFATPLIPVDGPNLGVG
jgi:hypothetical protein